MGFNGAKGAKGAKCCKTKPNLTKQGQILPNGAIRDHMVPNRTKWDKMEPMGQKGTNVTKWR